MSLTCLSCMAGQDGGRHLQGHWGLANSEAQGAQGSPGCFAGIHSSNTQVFNLLLGTKETKQKWGKHRGKKRKQEKKRQGGREKKQGQRKTKNPWLRTALKELVLSSVFTPL